MKRNSIDLESDINFLKAFQEENYVITISDIYMLANMTYLARQKIFPLNFDVFIAKNKGQVTKLGSSNMVLIIKYIDLLNEWHEVENIDFDTVEDFWAEQVREYFRNQPFILTADMSKTIGANLDDLFEQAKKRQAQNPGMQYLGSVLQHLTAAKLSIILPAGSFEIHGASTADAVTERSGDFVINNTIIHCTTAPSAPLIEKCRTNLRGGCYPVIITIFDRVRTVLDLASDAGLENRVEVWDIQQFLSANIYEYSLFNEANRNSTIADIIDKYNDIVSATETDPSLRIEFER